MHGKTGVADVPANQGLRIGERRRKRGLQTEPGTARRHKCCCGAIAELQHRKQRLDGQIILQMQRRKLYRDDQNACIGFGPDDMTRRLQRGHGGIATHEADQRAFDRSIEAKARRDDLVDPRCDESGAARHDKMRDAADVGQFRNRFQCKRRGGIGVKCHSRGRSRHAAGVKAVVIDRRSPLRAHRQHRPAVCDSRSPRHSCENSGIAAVGQAGRRPVDKGMMNIVARRGCADGNDTGTVGHARPSD